ncbi:MAG: ParB/RepB/Spo0J family partition protein [Magnetococcus sp. THC-1_WYH]
MGHEVKLMPKGLDMSDLTIQYLPTANLVLDHRNPRVAPALESMDGDPPQDFIKLALGQFAPDDEDKGASTTYSSLKASIRAYKGLINPIVVTPQDDGTYLVIEGNTRLSIYRELADEKSLGSWDTIPCIVRPGIEESGEHAIRLQAHLVGPRQWRPYAKAKYLTMLYMEEKLSINEIMDFCGGNARKREIEEYIAAYKDMQAHYMPLMGHNQPDYSRFTAFVELQKPRILPSIVKAGFTKDDFARWVNDSRISPISTVRQLPRILSNLEARKRFISHNAREAMKVLEQPSSNTAIKEATIEQLANELTLKIRSLNWPDVKELGEDRDSPRAQALLDCYEELRDLCKQTNLTSDDE